MDNMSDLQPRDLIHNDLIKFWDDMDYAMEKIQTDLGKVQLLLASMQSDNKKIASLMKDVVLNLHELKEESIILNGVVEDELCDVALDLDKSSCGCDEFDVVDGESLLQLFKEVATPHMLEDECIVDVEIQDKSYVIEASKSPYYSALEFKSQAAFGEYCDPFWSPILASSIEARRRLIIVNLVSTCTLVLDLMHERQLTFILKGGHVFVERTMVRDYDGFNGPGSSQCPFNFGLALIRDYDGFNGPGHTLRTRCLEGGSHVMVLYSIRGLMYG